MSNKQDPALDQLHKRMKERFPGAMVSIRGQRKWFEKSGFGLSVAKAEKKLLRRLALTAPEQFPIYVLGDDTVAESVKIIRENDNAQNKAELFSTYASFAISAALFLIMSLFK